jgi:hypothetical protein
MNPTTRYPLVSATVFGIVSLAHLARIVFGWPVEIAHDAIPAWTSVVATLAAATLCVWGFSLARRAR